MSLNLHFPHLLPVVYSCLTSFPLPFPSPPPPPKQESLINELSKEIDAHQAHFSSLKEELDKTKSNQKQLEGNYSSWLKDLEITVFNYWFTLKGRRFAEEEFGTAASATAATKAFTATGKLSSPRSPSPKTLVEGVKVLLGEFALLTRDSAVVDETLQKKEAKITELQQTLGRREHDQDQADRHVTDLADEVREGFAVNYIVCT